MAGLTAAAAQATASRLQDRSASARVRRQLVCPALGHRLGPQISQTPSRRLPPRPPAQVGRRTRGQLIRRRAETAAGLQQETRLHHRCPVADGQTQWTRPEAEGARCPGLSGANRCPQLRARMTRQRRAAGLAAQVQAQGQARGRGHHRPAGASAGPQRAQFRSLRRGRSRGPGAAAAAAAPRAALSLGPPSPGSRAPPRAPSAAAGSGCHATARPCSRPRSTLSRRRRRLPSRGAARARRSTGS